MTKSVKVLLVAILACAVTSVCNAQATAVLQTAGTFMKGKRIIDFYENAIAHPTQVLLLSAEIQQLFANYGSRYKGLSNKYAEQAGLFSKGPLALEHIVISPAPSPSSDYGYFSITLKKVNKKQCQVFVSDVALNGNFRQVKVNGVVVSTGGEPVKHRVICKSQLPFASGKNVVEYINN